jgi:hypothetical protein
MGQGVGVDGSQASHSSVKTSSGYSSKEGTLSGTLPKPQLSTVTDADIVRSSPRKVRTMTSAGATHSVLTAAHVSQWTRVNLQQREKWQWTDLLPDSDVISVGSAEESDVRRRIDFHDEHDAWNDSAAEPDNGTLTAITIVDEDSTMDGTSFRAPAAVAGGTRSQVAAPPIIKETLPTARLPYRNSLHGCFLVSSHRLPLYRRMIQRPPQLQQQEGEVMQ